MRADTDAGGRIVGTDIREQEQHQQSPSPTAHVGTPLHEVRVLVSETDVDVPAIVAGSILRGEADWKGAKAVTGVPPARPDKLIECLM
jgi:hypothetical protein